MRAPLLALLVLLAGCLDGDTEAVGGEPAVPPPPASPGPAPDEVVASPGQVVDTDAEPLVVVRLPFTKSLDGAKSSVGSGQEDAVLYADLTNATALVLELRWDSAVYDLDPTLILSDGCDEAGPPEEFAACMPSAAINHWLVEGDDGNYWVKDGSLGDPDSPVRLEIGRVALAGYGCGIGCSAMARVIAKDLAVDVSGELVLSVFRGIDVPAGYSALA
jgi:hypothetical protein